MERAAVELGTMTGASDPLLRLALLGGFVTGVLLSLMGVYLVYLGSSGNTEFAFFGQRLHSNNVGIAAIFIGAALIVLVIRRALASFDKLGELSHNTGSAQTGVPPERGHAAAVPEWFQQKDLQSLAQSVKDLSATQRKLMFEVARTASGRYISDLVENDKLGLTRREIVYIGRELESARMMKIEHLTDYLLKISGEVLAVVNNDRKLLSSVVRNPDKYLYQE